MQSSTAAAPEKIAKRQSQPRAAAPGVPKKRSLRFATGTGRCPRHRGEVSRVIAAKFFVTHVTGRTQKSRQRIGAARATIVGQ
jgi:hypothetical protein